MGLTWWEHFFFFFVLGKSIVMGTFGGHLVFSSLGYIRHGSKQGIERGGNEVAYIEFGSTNKGLAPGPRPRKGIQEEVGGYPLDTSLTMHRRLIGRSKLYKRERPARERHPLLAERRDVIVRKEKKSPFVPVCFTRDLEGERVDRLRGVEGGLGLISSRLLLQRSCPSPEAGRRF